VLIVNATGRDHPRRARLAVSLRAACGLPTMGVTDRPLVAVGTELGPDAGAASGLWLEGELVGYCLRTRAGARAVVVHAGWRVDAETARAVVLSVNVRGRTPEALRQARRLARTSRSATDEARP
jgi:deoxyribonuclease V